MAATTAGIGMHIVTVLVEDRHELRQALEDGIARPRGAGAGLGPVLLLGPLLRPRPRRA